jgi:hypothetical protein
LGLGGNGNDVGWFLCGTLVVGERNEVCRRRPYRERHTERTDR